MYEAYEEVFKSKNEKIVIDLKKEELHSKKKICEKFCFDSEANIRYFDINERIAEIYFDSLIKLKEFLDLAQSNNFETKICKFPILFVIM